MRQALRVVLALVAAAVVPVAAIVAVYAIGTMQNAEVEDPYGWARLKMFGVMALAIAAGHVLFLGVPTFLLLLWRRAVYWWSSVAAGFVLASIPLGVVSWPLRSTATGLRTSSSHWEDGKMVQTMVDGVPTLAGWSSYFEAVGFMGLFGAVGGLAFWVVWWSMRSNYALERTRGV